MTQPLKLASSAIFSDCGLHRLRLDRQISFEPGLVYAYFGINPSKAGMVNNDMTVLKWMGFTARNGGRWMIAANPITLVMTDVRGLAFEENLVHPHNAMHLECVIKAADVLVPCWGALDNKVPAYSKRLVGELLAKLIASGKPMKAFGFTKAGDPKHPARLGYDTPLVDWKRAA